MFFLDLQTLRAEDEGWLVLDVTAASDHWLLNRSKDLGLRLYMETEDGKDGPGRAPSPRLRSEGPGCIPALQLSTCDLTGSLPSKPVFSPVGGAFRHSLIYQVFRGGASFIPGSGRREPEGGPQIGCVTTSGAACVAGAEG